MDTARCEFAVYDHVRCPSRGRHFRHAERWDSGTGGTCENDLSRRRLTGERRSNTESQSLFRRRSDPDRYVRISCVRGRANALGKENPSVRRRDDNLDPRAWLAWAVAASLTPTLGRNPIALGATLVIVIAVREAWRPWARQLASWSLIIQMALIFAFIGVLFNVLTYHGGDRALFFLPGFLPVIGGAVTVNALVYGAASGLALLILV